MRAYCHVPPCGKGLTNLAGSWAHGAADLPYPQSSPAHGAAARGGRGGAWRMEEEDTGGGLVRCSPQNVAASALAWGIYNPAPAADCGGGGGGGCHCRWQAGKERLRRG